MRPVTRLALVVMAVIGASWLAACGEASSFPEPATCATPTPVTPSAGRGPSNPYFTGVRRSVDQLTSLREQLRTTYPSDKLSRSNSFRQDFAKYADETVCVATALRDLKPPSPTFEAFDTNLDNTLNALIDHTRAGREAVRTRNVSEYRDWYKEADVKLDAVKAAANAPRTR